MGCDYYIQSELIIEYIDENNAFSKIKTNRCIEKCYIHNIPEEDSDDDLETQKQKYYTYVEKMIKDNTYKKMLYINDAWIKTSYEKKYLKELKIICPKMIKIINIYKDYTSWKRM
jgi:hypothetical protein